MGKNSGRLSSFNERISYVLMVVEDGRRRFGGGGGGGRRAAEETIGDGGLVVVAPAEEGVAEARAKEHRRC